MEFRKLSEFLKKLDLTASRNEMTIILSELFKECGSEISQVCYLLQGGIAPSYKQVVFNLAEKHMISVIAKASGKENHEIVTIYKKYGDLGDTAFDVLRGKTSKISVSQVFGKLSEIAKAGGEGSVERKITLTSDLVKDLDSQSAKYVVRILLGKLRLGFSDLTMIDALSWMEKGDKSLKAQIEKAYRVMPDIGLLAKAIKEKGVEKATKNVAPIIGIPVSPMLAQRLKSPSEMIKKMGKVAVEPKFDGVRVLIHMNGNNVFAYTRNLNDVSYMFPELLEIKRHIKAKSVILDSEAIGMDEKQKQFLDFQTTMQRRRKHDIENIKSKIPLRFQVFDILYKDGESLMDKNYIERRKILSDTVINGNLLKVDEHIITEDPSVIEREYEEKLKSGLEGIIVKKAESAYVPGRTGFRWVKMKEAETKTGKLTDTVDAIVMGYTQGRGKRSQFGVGQFLVGVRDGETVKTITKVGTGLTDEQFRELNLRLKKIFVKEKPKEYEVHKDLEPDFWVTSSLIVELAADDITKSTKHTAEYALRFPRLVNFRDDKSFKEATTLKELKDLFELQKR
ncbi:MAG: ATP-dependent DNA ligase [Candidatus Woesebacteria bacterium]|nr:MAG: ATP-dependent DNA ligase [Candidatus Woesebacteria bacterium]